MALHSGRGSSLPRFISYLRGSTDGQGRSGPGRWRSARLSPRTFSSQRRFVTEFQDVESGKHADRPRLAAALASCRARRAALVIAKLDRPALNAGFLLSLADAASASRA